MVYFFWLATYLTHAWLVNDLWSNGHRFCLPFASLRVAMFLWETDTSRFGQVSCMLNLCASDCVHESGGMHVADPLFALQPGDRWDISVSSGLGRALMKKCWLSASFAASSL